MAQPEPTTGERVRAARQAQEIGRRALSVRSGVGYATIFEIETDGRSPRVITLQRIAEALGVPVGELIGPSA